MANSFDRVRTANQTTFQEIAKAPKFDRNDCHPTHSGWMGFVGTITDDAAGLPHCVGRNTRLGRKRFVPRDKARVFSSVDDAAAEGKTSANILQNGV